MKKIVFVAVVIGLSVFGMSACDTITIDVPNQEPSETVNEIMAEETVEPTMEQIVENHNNEENQQGNDDKIEYIPAEPIFTFDTGTVIYAYAWGGSGELDFDLNCDGIDEKIEFEFVDYQDIGVEYDENEDFLIDGRYYGPIASGCRIKIDDNEHEFGVLDLACMVLIVDVDINDNRYEVLLSDFGPSSDLFTYFFTYENDEMIEVGSMEGLSFVNMKIAGDGIVNTQSRGRILHTWFYDSKWQYIDGALVEVFDNENNYVLMNTPVIMKKQISFQVSPTDSNYAFGLDAGDDAVITYTDNVRWICLEDDLGNVGWYDLGDNPFYGGELFDGLCYAD